MFSVCDMLPGVPEFGFKLLQFSCWQLLSLESKLFISSDVPGP